MSPATTALGMSVLIQVNTKACPKSAENGSESCHDRVKQMPLLCIMILYSAKCFRRARSRIS